MAWYGANSGGSDGLNARMMVVDACNILDSQVDFSQYDRDGDGTIDNVFLFYAGLGEATGGGADSVWPHSAEVIGSYSYDGRTLRTYGCTNEWVMDNATSGHPDAIGTFCHEFGHVLGLPDLYATTYPTPAPFTPGHWSLMDVGAYNNNGRTPPALDLFSRYALGWWEPVVLDSPVDGRLLPLSAGGSGYLVPTADPDEYFLIENRQRSGWDTYIPGHGMLVWHVEYNPAIWINHTVNNDARHQYVDILEADGVQSDATRGGDAFPGDAAVTAITGATNPGFVTAAGTPLAMSVTDIAELPDGTVTFKALGGATPAPAVTALDAADITPRSFTARWQAADGAVDYRLTVLADGAPVNGYDDRLAGDVTECPVTGLEPANAYTYTVTAVLADRSSLPSEPVALQTLPLTFAYELPRPLEAADISDNGFTAAWEPVDGADGYLLEVWERRLRGTSAVTEAFDGKTSVWNTNSSSFYMADSYVGRTAPSLKLDPDGFVATPLVERGTLRSLTFWHRARNTATGWFTVDAYAAGCWRTVAELVPETAKGGATLTVVGFPDDAVCARLYLHDPQGQASAYVDDFTLVYGGTETRAGDTAINTTAASASVGSLQPGTVYCWTVTALSGADRSLPSPVQYTATSGQSGITAVRADSSAMVEVCGRRVTNLSADAVAVYGLDGRPVTTLQPSGSAALAPGVYVAKGPAGVRKLLVR